MRKRKNVDGGDGNVFFYTHAQLHLRRVDGYYMKLDVVRLMPGPGQRNSQHRSTG